MLACASIAARRRAALSSAIQLHSITTETVMAMRPGFVIPNKRKIAILCRSGGSAGASSLSSNRFEAIPKKLEFGQCSVVARV